ncbi:LOW QUALITY PROTEIN: cilia- and flagella-associated protein 90 [Discoglossus pictus]
MEAHIKEEYDEAKAEFLKGKSRQPPLSSLSAYSYVPVQTDHPKELSYFYQQSKDDHIPTYSIFKRPQGYNEKLHRDDREHASYMVKIHEEESSRPMAVLSSSEYGRHLNLKADNMYRDHVRIELVRVDFYRKNGNS